jgi:rhodanese-related sulfurtransferase
MKDSRVHLMNMFVLIVGTSVAASVLAAEPVPIAAESAFDAFSTQTDPQTGYQKVVALIDVRSRAEYFWVGTATQVDEIILENGSSVEPDLGKVILDHEGKFLTFTLNGRDKRVQVGKVDSLVHSPIAINIPFKLWNEETAKLEGNPDFATGIASLVQDGVEVLIVYCRTGGRSTDCTYQFDTDAFFAVYEIDDPAENRGYGGFEGSSYSNVYNGYLGFPGRQTSLQAVPSVSWKDSGLPMKTLINPLQ